jgi:hypothetical protein
MATTDDFVDRYGRSIGVVFAGLFLTWIVPVVNLVRLVPLFKEAVLGVLVVVAFTSLEDWGQGAKHALVSGMIAAVAFNVVRIPAGVVLGGLAGAAGGGAGAAETAAFAGALSGLGALTNVVGLVLFSPLGYIAGGAVGGLLN